MRIKIARVDLNKGNSGGWFDARAVFEDMLPGNCQIVHYGEDEKTRHHDEGAMWRFYSVARNPMKKKQSDPMKKKTEWFWNYHCQNQGGMCYRHILAR